MQTTVSGTIADPSKDHDGETVGEAVCSVLSCRLGLACCLYFYATFLFPTRWAVGQRQLTQEGGCERVQVNQHGNGEFGEMDCG